MLRVDEIKKKNVTNLCIPTDYLVSESQRGIQSRMLPHTSKSLSHCSTVTSNHKNKAAHLDPMMMEINVLMPLLHPSLYLPFVIFPSPPYPMLKAYKELWIPLHSYPHQNHTYIQLQWLTAARLIFINREVGDVKENLLCFLPAGRI